MTEPVYNQAIPLITRDLSLRKGDLPEEVSDLSELRSLLIPIVSHLMDTDFNHLLNVLYRIDVQESKVKKTLAEGQPDAIAGDISDLIIERELQKVELRRRYGSKF